MSVTENAINYSPSVTGVEFHMDTASLVRHVHGCVGSGKTSMCVMEIFLSAIRQAPDASGVRSSRWVAIRSTRPELKSTVIKTWEYWFGSLCETVYDTPIRSTIYRTLPDGTKLDLEVWFLALEDEASVKKLRSLEVTGGYISEASDVSEKVLEMLMTRIGRFPKVGKDFAGPTWSGIIMESNPPSVKHWLYRLFEVDRPATHRIFKQPAPLIYNAEKEEYYPNPEAENILNLPNGYDYYMRQIPSMSKDFIRVFIMGEYGMSFSGKPVYPQFAQSVHISKNEMRAIPGQVVVVGFDFGLQSAAVFTQLSPIGALLVLDEVSPQDCTLEEFITAHVMPKRAAHFSNCPLLIVGDPAGNQRSSLNVKTAFDILRSFGLAARPAGTNDIVHRVKSVAYFLDRRGGFFINPSCTNTIEALSGAYKYRKRRANDVKAEYQEKPDKNDASHICFPAGTMVAVPNGSKPIETIRAGDEVVTPFGVRRVICQAMTSPRAKLVRITLSDNTSLECTPDHPIWVGEKGLVQADALQYGDTVKRHGDSKCQVLLSFKGSGFTKTKSKGTGNVTVGSRQTFLSICTELFGSIITGLYRLGMKYTTSITTRTITTYQTLLYYMEQVTHRITQNTDMLLAACSNPVNLLCAKPQSGTAVSMALHGIKKMVGSHGLLDSTNRSLAPIAQGPSLDLSVQTNEGFAQTSVSPQLDVSQVSTTLKQHALRATQKSTETNTQKPVSVVSVVALDIEAPVYSIQVDEVGLHYANGVLVSNCDALQYACLQHKVGSVTRPVRPKTVNKGFLFA